MACVRRINGGKGVPVRATIGVDNIRSVIRSHDGASVNLEAFGMDPCDMPAGLRDDSLETKL